MLAGPIPPARSGLVGWDGAAVAGDRHAFRAEAGGLVGGLVRGEAAVGVDDAPPRQVVAVAGEERAAGAREATTSRTRSSNSVIGGDRTVPARLGTVRAVIRKHVVIEGRVQGLGFRVACAHRARQAGLVGTVRNRPDGTVEAVFEGLPEAVDQLVAWCSRGPTPARVTRVRVSEEPVRGEQDFRVV